MNSNKFKTKDKYYPINNLEDYNNVFNSLKSLRLMPAEILSNKSHEKKFMKKSIARWLTIKSSGKLNDDHFPDSKIEKNVDDDLQNNQLDLIN